MKNCIVFFFLMFALIACEKHENIMDETNSSQEVSFIAKLINTDPQGNSIKDWECKPYEPDYAQVTISGTDYFPKVYRLNGSLCSQRIVLSIPVGDTSANYQISKFLLWDDGGTSEGVLETDDTIMMGTPDSASFYAKFVGQPLDFIITVSAFKNLEVSIDVLCFINDTINNLK